MKIKILCLLLALVSFLTVFAQSPKGTERNWQPTGQWPFVNEKFQVGTVVSGVFKISKTQVPCNIHVGKHSLYFAKDDTLREAIGNSVLRVEFPNGDAYMPVNSEGLGRIVREDSLCGAMARLICLQQVNMSQLDDRDMKIRDNFRLAAGEIPGLSGYASQLTDVTTSVDPLELPLPITNVFYIQFKGELFQATTKNIIAHIPKERKNEYRVFTRSAEILSDREDSMLKVWNEFFVNQDPLKASKRK